ncbi:ABC transporter B family member 11 [Vigna angularis]|uniref:ABC transporter B family member 11 n=1 Tax=Phaseolus angularis TaxID=3914 RepID=A0A8T0JUL9_PHAAN|nr:ABC transporter B family member 11 [Vigna angularis]
MDGKGSSAEREEQRKQKGKAETVPFRKLFAFADCADIMLMAVGSIGAIGNGLGFPLMTLLFGEIIHSFGSNQNSSGIVEKVSQVSLKFVYLAVGSGVAAFLQVTCWMVTGERQAARIRELYLKTILRQDIAFFDKATNTGEVIGRISGDTVLIQEAMGEKVGKFVQLIATFVGGFAISFAKGWLLTLVMLCLFPLLVASGAAMAIMQGRMASRGQVAYAKAAHIVQQTIASIRTVRSLTYLQTYTHDSLITVNYIFFVLIFTVIT